MLIKNSGDQLVPNQHGLTSDELRAQLFCYAKDLQISLERYELLEGQFQALTIAYKNLLAQHESSNGRLHEVEWQLNSAGYSKPIEAVMVTSITGEILSVNNSFTEITGYSAEEVIGGNPNILNSGMQDDEFYQVLWQSLRETGSWNGKLQNRRKNGEIYTEWLAISTTRGSNGTPQNYIAVFSDVSKTIESEQRIAFLAYHDSLTRLPNRHLFQERLEQLLGLSLRTGQPFTLIYIDLDDFKEINDNYGHQTGDFVLQVVSNRLTQLVRKTDTVARLGGDEFAIIAPGLTGDKEINYFCQKAISALKVVIPHSGVDVSVGASFGCATFPQHGKNIETLLDHADMAMYQAKLAGGDNCRIYVAKN